MTNSLSDLLRSLDTNNQDVHQSVLKLARACSATESAEEGNLESKDESWMNFIELVVSNLCFGDQQHFYNLGNKKIFFSILRLGIYSNHIDFTAYLDWLLTCLSYLTGKCQWNKHKKLLISLGNALIELIISFHGAGTYSYMGLSITRNSILCLNHLLYQMQKNFDKSVSLTQLNEYSVFIPIVIPDFDDILVRRRSLSQLVTDAVAESRPSRQSFGSSAFSRTHRCPTHSSSITERCCASSQRTLPHSAGLRNKQNGVMHS